MQRPTSVPPEPRQRPRHRRRAARLLTAVAVAAFVSAGSAGAMELEAPEAPTPPAPVELVEPTPPAAPDPVVITPPAPPEPVAPAPAAADVSASAAAPVIDVPAPAEIDGGDAAITATAAAGSGSDGSDGASSAATPATTALDTAERDLEVQPRDHCDHPAAFHAENDRTCMVNVCHATGSDTNPYVLITISENGLNGHLNSPHQGGEDIVGVSTCPGAPDDPDDCPPGQFQQGGTCFVTVCHSIGGGRYNELSFAATALPAHLAHGDIYPVPAGGCPEDVFDACPNLDGDQPAGTDCFPTFDACPNLDGDQPAGTDCFPAIDACPNLDGFQSAGTVCDAPVEVPVVPTLMPTPTPVQPVEPIEPTDTPVAGVDETPVAGVADDPEVVDAVDARTLPFTGASVLDLALFGLGAMIVGAVLLRRRPGGRDA